MSPFTLAMLGLGLFVCVAGVLGWRQAVGIAPIRASVFHTSVDFEIRSQRLMGLIFIIAGAVLFMLTLVVTIIRFTFNAISAHS